MKAVTTRDVAKAAGVSQSTVSAVLSKNPDISISEATRDKVLRVAEEMNYLPVYRRRGHRDKAPVIGLLVPTLTNLYYPFFAHEIETYAGSLGISTVLCNTVRNAERESHYLNYLLGKGVDGIIYLYSPQMYDTNCKKPVVIVGEAEDSPYDIISLDSFCSGKMIAEHLLELGHRHIAFLSTPMGRISYSRTMRHAGVRDAMREAGCGDNLVVLSDNSEQEIYGESYEFTVGERLAALLLEKHPETTAIVGVNDMVAAGALSTLHENGVAVPDKMAVCGFDNLLVSRVSTPKVTTVDHCFLQRGKMAVNLIKDKIDSADDFTNRIKVDYEPLLIVRGSTVPAR